MAINLENIRNELLPGLEKLGGSYPALPQVWADFYQARASTTQLSKSLAPIESVQLSPQAVVLMGAAAIIAKNPTVSRRFWGRWK